MALIAPFARVARSTNRSTPSMAITRCRLQNVTIAGDRSVMETSSRFRRARRYFGRYRRDQACACCQRLIASAILGTSSRKVTQTSS